MSTQQYDRWLILPPTTEDHAGRTITVPAYTGRGGIDGYSGTLAPSETIGERYADLVADNPAHEEWYIARLYGARPTLGDISDSSDTRNLASRPDHVDAILSDRFPELGAADWDSQFFVH